MIIPPFVETIAEKVGIWVYKQAKCKVLSNKIAYKRRLSFKDSRIVGKLNLIIKSGIQEKLIHYGVQFFQEQSLQKDKLIKEEINEYNFGHGIAVDQGANFDITVDLSLTDSLTITQIKSRKIYYRIIVKFSNGCIIYSTNLFL